MLDICTLGIVDIYTLVGWLDYAALAFVALLGGYFCVMVWRRVAQKRFKSEAAQDDFLDELEVSLSKGDFEGAAALCEGDLRAVPQLAHLAILNRGVGFAKLRQMIEDRFQRDILSQLEYQMTWVHTVIKSAPMLGLFGTVSGMMGAFQTLDHRRECRTVHAGQRHQRRADYDGRWLGNCDSFDRHRGGHQHPHSKDGSVGDRRAQPAHRNDAGRDGERRRASEVMTYG